MAMADYPRIELLIDGEWRTGIGAIPVLNPADGSVLGHAPCAGPVELDAAAEAAERGFAVWSRTPPAERCRIILEAVSLIRQRRETLASVMTLEQGKPIGQSRIEVDRAADLLTWDANEGLRLYGRVIPARPGLTQTVLRQPVGPVASFSPWNFPVSSPARKIGGALAAGCSLVLKPSEETPASAVLMARAFQDAGLPPGVLNIVFGDPPAISRHLIRHPAVRLIAFTGSVAVGKELAAMAGSEMKPVIMELGGHAPVIVCKDADLSSAAARCVAAKARNAGQVCVAPTRFLVEAPVHDEFVSEVMHRVETLKPGDGTDPASALGPLANARRLEAMDRFVGDALGHGARLLAGGARPNTPGFHYPFTVLADVSPDCLAMREEVFGPLMLIRRERDLDQAIEQANSTPYALAAYAFTDSARTIARLAEELRCGNLAVNHFTASTPETPFGGIGDSGHGREGGTEGLEGYTVTKLVSAATD